MSDNTPTTPDFSLLKHHIDQATHIAMFVHRSPDGDCLGAGLGLGQLIENMGKKVTYYCTTKVPQDFFMFPKVEEISSQFAYEQDIDLCIFVDIAAIDPMVSGFWNGNEEYFTLRPTICIDHHPTNTGFAQLNYVDAQASSACEYITEMITTLRPDKFTSEIATYLFMGLSTDTGHFTYTQNNTRTFQAALTLCQHGADPAYIVKHLYRSKSLKQLKAFSFLADRVTQHGKILYTRVQEEELIAIGSATEGVSGSFMNRQFTSIKHDGIFVLFKTVSDDPGAVRCSLRCKNPDIHVGQLAQHFNGGGHAPAAGCRISFEGRSFEQTMQDTLQKMDELLS